MGTFGGRSLAPSQKKVVKGEIVHTKAPPSFGPQVRTGTLSADGDTITGRAVFAKGGGHDFLWKRLAKKSGEKQ
jgi:hypothetical protein